MNNAVESWLRLSLRFLPTAMSLGPRTCFKRLQTLSTKLHRNGLSPPDLAHGLTGSWTGNFFIIIIIDRPYMLRDWGFLILVQHGFHRASKKVKGPLPLPFHYCTGKMLYEGSCSFAHHYFSGRRNPSNAGRLGRPQTPVGGGAFLSWRHWKSALLVLPLGNLWVCGCNREPFLPVSACPLCPT